jgi:hypothetical protein
MGHRMQLPLPTVAVLAVLALVVWVNAIVNRYRFNVALALLASIPLAVVLIRSVLKARAAGGPAAT